MSVDKAQPEQDPSEGSRKTIERELDRMPDRREKDDGSSHVPRMGGDHQQPSSE